MNTSGNKTRTGNFPIGFRRGWSDWQRDLTEIINWAKTNGFSAIDVGRDASESVPPILAAGLSVGSADLLVWQDMIAADAGKRRAAVERNAEYVRTVAALGVKNFFLVMLPENPALPRSENFAFMVESFGELAPALESSGARLVIEGYPGAGALCCTPEGYRAFFAACPSPTMGINYDPSHLLRMGIDPLRFLSEFASRVGHVHGKDTELLSDGLYEYGSEQPPTFGKPVAFGAMHWRYTIPGHGATRWTEAFRILTEAGYAGDVCVELEDVHFNGSEDGEKSGLLASLHYLQSC